MSIFCHFWIKGVSIQYLRHRNYTSTSSLGAMSSCPAFGKFARGRADHTKSAQCDRKTSSTWSRVPWPSILVLESRSLTLVNTSLEPRINWQIKKYSTVLISTNILCGLCRIFYSTVQYMYCNLFLAGMCCPCFTAPFMGRGEHIRNQDAMKMLTWQYSVVVSRSRQ